MLHVLSCEFYFSSFCGLLKFVQTEQSYQKQTHQRTSLVIQWLCPLPCRGHGFDPWFNSDDHYIYYCGQEYLRRNGVAIMVNKRVQNAVLGCNLKSNRMISVRFQGKPFNITVIQVYAPTSKAE